MATRKSARTAGGSRIRDGRIRIRGQEASRLTAAPSDGRVAEITVARALFNTLQRHKEAMGKLLSSYAEAVTRAQRLARPVDMIVTVDPKKETLAIVAKAAKGDALDQALIDARSRGATRVAEILRSPDMVTAREFGALIGASHETVNQKRKSGEVLALEGATRGLRYPRWQITPDGRPLPGLAELFRELGEQPWAVYRFLLQRHSELGGETALAALRSGRVKQALAVARNLSAGVFA